MTTTLNFCTYENRASHLTGIKFLALSLEKYCRNFHLTVFLSPDLLFFRDWAEQHCPHVSVEARAMENKGWNVKPEILLHLLANRTEAIWIDSDILCLRDLTPFFDQLEPNTIVVAQDALPYPQEEARTRFFGLPFLRKLEKSVNSCLIRVTRHHVGLLEAWAHLLSSDLYRHNQTLPHGERPPYMIGDQDVLEAILASNSSTGQTAVPIIFLGSGKEIITTIVPEAFSLSDRLRSSFGINRPYLIHGQGIQPWEAVQWGQGVLGTARWQLSAYLGGSKKYRAFLEEDVSGWMDVRTKFTRFCQVISFYHPYLQGIPFLLASSFWRQVLAFRRMFSR